MTIESVALALVLAPLAAFFVALVGFRNRHNIAAGVVILGGLISAAASVYLLIEGHHGVVSERWFHISGVDIDFGVLLDGRTLVMGAVVGIITLCIQVYSLSYMSHDPGRGRFFSFLALFEWAMLSFVYAPTLLQTFIFWEIVGLASFLLIGFWYQKPSAVAAAKKAFIMTRIGDIGLFIGLILLFQDAGTLSITDINQSFAAAGLPEGMSSARVELVAALMFMGIVGKSAQFPLHTWLPDAMEGPTPVSALLHSATMVAAGVFLFARFQSLFLDAETTRLVVLAIATFTAVLASTMAVVAKDMKKILAYSSISQLGFMLIGLAAGSLFAGYFHLTTHAFFKALLFLCAGAYIHHYGTNDIVAIGRAGGRAMKVTTIGLVIGGASLAGIPLFSGFFSKEQIIASVGGVDGAAGMIFLVVFPNTESAAEPDEPAYSQSHGDDDDDDDHHHDDEHDASAPWAMKAPILLLSAGALVLGFFGDRIGELLESGLFVDMHAHHAGIVDMLPAIVVALLGLTVAGIEFVPKGASQRGFVSRIPSLEQLFVNRWYIDAIYKRTVVALALGIARLSYGVETRGLDGGSDGLARATVSTGGVVARGQSGRLQVYVGVAVAIAAVAVLYLGYLEFKG